MYSWWGPQHASHQHFIAGPDRGCYYHEMFLRGKGFLASSIKRTSVKGGGPRKADTPESDPDFFEMRPLPATTVTHISQDTGTVSTVASLVPLLAPQYSQPPPVEPIAGPTSLSSLLDAVAGHSIVHRLNHHLRERALEARARLIHLEQSSQPVTFSMPTIEQYLLIQQQQIRLQQQQLHLELQQQQQSISPHVLTSHEQTLSFAANMGRTSIMADTGQSGPSSIGTNHQMALLVRQLIAENRDKIRHDSLEQTPGWNGN